MLVGKEHNAFVEMISKLNFKLVVLFTVLFSLLMNIGHVFQYRINYGWSDLIIESHTTGIFYPSIVVSNMAFNDYTMVYFILNFVVFFLVNTWVELSLLQNLRKEIKSKNVKLSNEIKESRSKNVSRLEVIDKMNRLKQKKIDLDKKKETRATVMVVTNSGLNIFLRFPEVLILLSSNYNFLYWMVNAGDFSVHISAVLVSFSYFAYILLLHC
jgi:hypothetical protein